MNNVAIIGGGLSGSLLALNLLRHACSADSIRIFLIDRRHESDLGPAYSTNEEYLVLNVPASRMGAFPANPEHFLTWAQSKGVPATAWDFLPRKLYREYIQELLEQALRETKGNISLKRIRREVVDIERNGSETEVRMQGDRSLPAHRVVLALGNFPPRNLQIKNRSFLNSERYIQNPWSPGLISSLREHDTVLLIGTGQTMVDLAINLHMRKHRGRIVAVSRHGFLPLAHKKSEPYPSFYGEIKDLKTVTELVRIIRKHFDAAESMGIDKMSVIDSMRPDTQELWMHLPAEEKSRFLRHVFRYWEIIRSRIPPDSEAIINQMRSSGQLDIKAGRIRDLMPKDHGIEVLYSPPGEARQEIETANLVINCVGPETDYTKIRHPLIENLIRRGLIQPDPVHLGIRALPNGAIIHEDGTASDLFYTLGSPMKGILWEVIAAPEIRVQAEQLARLLLRRNGDSRAAS